VTPARHFCQRGGPHQGRPSAIAKPPSTRYPRVFPCCVPGPGRLVVKGFFRMATHRRIEVSKVGDVTLVKFADKKILDEANIQELGVELFSLVEQDNRKAILLDFSNVEFLSSAALGKLITLDRKVKTHKGRLKMCSIRPEIYEVFQITKLNKVFDIRKDQPEAMSAFA
jgi:anti-sigma B factor antagonist